MLYIRVRAGERMEDIGFAFDILAKTALTPMVASLATKRVFTSDTH